MHLSPVGPMPRFGTVIPGSVAKIELNGLPAIQCVGMLGDEAYVASAVSKPPVTTLTFLSDSTPHTPIQTVSYQHEGDRIFHEVDGQMQEVLVLNSEVFRPIKSEAEAIQAEHRRVWGDLA